MKQRDDTHRSVDKAIGRRVRIARNMLGISQERLADQIGLTFQQVQKYEKGSNRISGSRMVAIADVLQRPVAWFFQDVQDGKAETTEPGRDLVTRMLEIPYGVALAQAFLAIEHNANRHNVLAITEALAAAPAGGA